MLIEKIRAVACLVWFVIILQLHDVHAQAEPAERTPIFSAAWINHGTNASYLHSPPQIHVSSPHFEFQYDSICQIRGKIGLADEGKSRYTDLVKGDVLRVLQGVVFFIYCNPKTVFPLQIHAIFINSNYDLRRPEAEPYASIQDLVLGFDRKELQATFKVSVGVIDQVLGAKKPPLITRVDDPKFLRGNKIDKIPKANIFKEDQDFKNSYGSFTSLSREALNGSDVGFFMMNLTAGSIMEPNWNSMHEEVLVVLEGRGMVSVVCSEFSQMRGCTKRFEVRVGDVFVVPRLHAKALMAFDDEPLILIGFARVSLEKKKPQFIGGRYLGIDVVAKTFNVTNTTVAQLLEHSKDDHNYQIILPCTSCVEEESRKKEQPDGVVAPSYKRMITAENMTRF